MRSFKGMLILTVLFPIVFYLSACSTTQGDIKTAEVPEKESRLGVYNGYTSPVYDGIKTSSFYVTMRDGVKIAVDLHLPKGLGQGKKIPTILNQTRYVRRVEYRWPFNLFNEESWGGDADDIRLFVSYGYAWGKVDARGSGASFGMRTADFSPDEVKDGAEVVDWIIRQPWSDGKVGSFGWSYTGTTSELLLVNNHPAVKAIAPRFALFDTYTDIAFPGGIHSKWFLDTWGRLNSILDRNAWKEFGLMAGLAIRGSMPVDEDGDRLQLNSALEDHKRNYDVYGQTHGAACRDELPPGAPGRIDEFSPHNYLDKLESSGAAIYSFSGWFDGAYQHAAIKRFTSLSNSQKLTLGPWDHSICIRPWWPNARKSEFEFGLEMLRFFDYHLMGIENGIMEEPPVRYYTMVEEKWKSAENWPPPSEPKRFYFSKGYSLSLDKSGLPEGFDAYEVDYSAGTDLKSRWVSLVNVDGITIEYVGWDEKDKKLLCYTSTPLKEDMEVTGHPVVHLYVASTENDGNFFVYLQDVGPDGQIHYVTDGQLRALHRKISEQKPPYTSRVPYRTYKRNDAAALEPGEVAELVFDLLPTSYLFREGHSIRVAIAGADKDHFPLMKVDPPPTLKFYRNNVNASAIDLPVVPR